jgi:hypothetical protein
MNVFTAPLYFEENLYYRNAPKRNDSESRRKASDRDTGYHKAKDTEIAQAISRQPLQSGSATILFFTGFGQKCS